LTTPEREDRTVDAVWQEEAYEASLTRTCFSSTAYDEGWSNQDVRNDTEMRRLLEMEHAVQPVRVWNRKVVRQIEEMPPCGWCFPEYVETVCRGIGAGAKWGAWSAPKCYTVGPERLALMAHYAVCLDGWVKRVPAETVAGDLARQASGGRDWHAIASRIWDTLGEPSPLRVLLVSRLLARLRFWLRAPFEPLKADDNWRLGYFYTNAMSREGGWDYFSFDRHDPECVELDEQIRAKVSHPNRWLDLIASTWPCAPKVFRYLERIIIAIGALEEGDDRSPTELAGKDHGKPVLDRETTYLDSATSRRLFGTAIHALSAYVGNGVAASPAPDADEDSLFSNRLREVLGEASPDRVWLAALLLKRVTLFESNFRSFHFTRNPHQS
jgi:hypothetical protein